MAISRHPAPLHRGGQAEAPRRSPAKPCAAPSLSGDGVPPAPPGPAAPPRQRTGITGDYTDKLAARSDRNDGKAARVAPRPEVQIFLSCLILKKKK